MSIVIGWMLIISALCLIIVIGTASYWRMYWLRRRVIRLASLTASEQAKTPRGAYCILSAYLRSALWVASAGLAMLFAYASWDTAIKTGDFGIVHSALATAGLCCIVCGVIADHRYSKGAVIISHQTIVLVLPHGIVHYRDSHDLKEIVLTSNGLEFSFHKERSFMIPLWFGNLESMFRVWPIECSKDNFGWLVVRKMTT
jgi:hypothetical protein